MDSVLQAFHPPLHDPVVVIALAIAVFLGAPILFERLRLPATVAFIAAGAVLGPNGLNWIARDETIVLLGTVGLLYLMFMAAVEIDLHDFHRNRSRSIFFGILGFLAPQLLGFTVARALGYQAATAGPRALVVMVAMIVTVLPAKWLAAWLTRRRFRYSLPEALTMFGLSVPQAAATLAIALIGFRVRLFDAAVLNATIIIILVTSTLGPWLVERYGRRVALGEQRRAFRPGTEPQRILIPIIGPGDTETLVDLALLLRSPGTREPLLPLAVVPPAGRSTTASVAGAEKLLGHAVMRATGAGVTAVPLTRVAYDLADGIGRGVAESRATTILLGWDGRRDKRRSVLNYDLDQAVARTQQLVVVASLAGPVKPLKHLVVVLPPALDRSPGFADAIHAIKLVASRLTADVVFEVVRTDVAAMQALVGRGRPAVPERYEEAPSWSALLRMLEQRTGNDTLVVLFSERRGLLAWQREMDRMPRRLAGVARNLCIVYPRTAASDHPVDNHVLAMIGETLQAERIAAGLRAMSPEGAIETMLRTEFQGDSPRLVEALTAIERDLAGAAVEITPGAHLLFGRMSQLAAPLLFIGTSAQGIAFPAASGPARVIVAILVPTDHPTAATTYRDQLRPVLGNPSRVDELATATTTAAVASLFRAEDHANLPPVASAA